MEFTEVMFSHSDALAQYRAMVKRCSIDAESQLRLATHPPRLYLYCKPGLLLFVDGEQQAPADMQLVTNAHLPRSIAYYDIFQWIHERARRAPCLEV